MEVWGCKCLMFEKASKGTLSPAEGKELAWKGQSGWPAHRCEGSNAGRAGDEAREPAVRLEREAESRPSGGWWLPRGALLPVPR